MYPQLANESLAFFHTFNLASRLLAFFVTSLVTNFVNDPLTNYNPFIIKGILSFHVFEIGLRESAFFGKCLFQIKETTD